MKSQQGFVKTIILIVIALIVLKFVFGISLSDIINSRIIKDIIEILRMLLKLLWEALTTTLDFIKLVLMKGREFLQSIPTK